MGRQLDLGLLGVSRIFAIHHAGRNDHQTAKAVECGPDTDHRQLHQPQTGNNRRLIGESDHHDQ